MAELIDRLAVYETACRGCIRHGNEPGECYHDEPCERLIFAFTTAPDIEPERPKGRWEETDWVEYDGHSECIRRHKAGLRCSNCCNVFKKDLLWKRNFCPNCGADMRG